MAVQLSTLRKRLFHSVTAPPSQVQADLGQLRTLDRQIEDRLKRINSLIPWAFLGGFLFFFVCALLFNVVLSNPGLLSAFPVDLVLLLLIVFSLGAIICWVLPFTSKKLDPLYLTKLGNQFLILALLSVLVLIILQIPLLFLNPFSAALITAIGIVSLFMIRGRTKVLDLPNYRYELADRVVSLLSRDMDMTSRMSLKILFKKQVDKPIRTIPFTRRAGWNIDICDNEWLKIKAPLLNSHWIQLSLTERYRKRYGRNINGKLREKYQQRGLEVKLGIRLLGKSHWDLNQLRDHAKTMVRLPGTTVLKQLTLSEDLLKMKVLIPNWLGGSRSVSMIWPQDPSVESIRHVQQVILMMILSAFQILNFARVLSRSKTA